MIIGVTGGVGAGKTLVLNYLKEKHGALVLLADEIAKELLKPENEVGRKVRALFPAELFAQDGSIKPAQMADYIFHHPKMRKTQNDIVFPRVKEEICRNIERNRDKELIVVEAALLIEEHYDEICDVMWYIYSSEENRTRRLLENRGYCEERIRAMMDSQLSEEAFRRGCDAVIDNDGIPEHTYESIEALLKEYGIGKNDYDTVRRV